MYYDLDREIDYIVSESFGEGSLDIEIVSDSVLECGTLYHEFSLLKNKFEGKQIELISPVRPTKGRCIYIDDLLCYDGEVFVDAAYLTVLGRVADQLSLQRRTEELEKGERTKEDILKHLEESGEGRKLRVGLVGFKEVKMEDLLKCEDSEFINKAYLRILKRYPDEKGYYNYLKLLRTGKRNKEEIIALLRNSPEGEKKAVNIIGLKEVQAAETEPKEQSRLRPGFLKQLDQVQIQVSQMGQRLGEEIERGIKRDRILQRVFDELEELQIKLRKAESTEIAVRNKADDLTRNIWCLSNEQNSIKSKLQESINRYEQKTNVMEDTDQELGKGIQALNLAIDQMGKNIRELNEVSSSYGDLLNAIKRGEIGVIEKLYAEISTLKAGMTLREMKNAEEDIDRNQKTSDVALMAGILNKNVYDSIDYFDFENHFRGSREHIKKVQELYLPYFEGRKNVLDLGCGRGEFTELLIEKGIGVTGVDLYPPYVEYMKMRGLPAVLGDAVDYLEKQESTDGVFLGQVVEHISTEQILKICRLAYDKLEDGCCLVIETPNPASLAIFYNWFYVDPSHQKPVHPLTLKYIVEKAGFSSVEVLFTESSRVPRRIPKLQGENGDFEDFNREMEHVSDLLYGSQDYAVIARKQV